MQLWTPPTPPQDDNDIYIDSVMCLMYETTPIPEAKLPPVYVRKERKRHKTDPSGMYLSLSAGMGGVTQPLSFVLCFRLLPFQERNLDDYSCQ